MRQSPAMKILKQRSRTLKKQVTVVNVLCRPPAVASGDPLELSKEAAGEEQTCRILQEPLPDLLRVRWKPAETRAVRLPQSGQSRERTGETLTQSSAGCSLH